MRTFLQAVNGYSLLWFSSMRFFTVYQLQSFQSHRGHFALFLPIFIFPSIKLWACLLLKPVFRFILFPAQSAPQYLTWYTTLWRYYQHFFIRNIRLQWFLMSVSHVNSQTMLGVSGVFTMVTSEVFNFLIFCLNWLRWFWLVSLSKWWGASFQCSQATGLKSHFFSNFDFQTK